MSGSRLKSQAYWLKIVGSVPDRKSACGPIGFKETIPTRGSVPRGGASGPHRNTFSPGGEIASLKIQQIRQSQPRDLDYFFRAHGDRPRELPARWRTIPWKTE